MNAIARPNPWILLLLGAATGMLSGLFGIGGGVLLVPMLVLILGFPQRLAAGTSVAAILPAAILGGISFGLQGNVDWIAAVLLAIGVVVGAQFGSYFLSRAPVMFLRWMFMCFLLAVIVGLWLVVPQRDDIIGVNLLSGSLLILTGLVTGVFSGLLGVGGGIIVVPILMFFFGSSDLIAKGTSLAMMIPGSVSATLGNAKRKNVDLRSAVVLGLAASALAPLGAVLATTISPYWSNIAFSLLLTLIFGQMLVHALRNKK